MKYVLAFMVGLWSVGIASAQNPNDVPAAFRRLDSLRIALQQQRSTTTQTPTLIRQMLAVGLWSEALAAIASANPLRADERAVLQAEYDWLNNDFAKAEQHARQALRLRPANRDARRLLALLAIEAWRLPQAEQACRQLLKTDAHDTRTALLLGRALLLQKKYAEALLLAQQLQQRYPTLAEAHLLEALVYFWNQQPERAEAPLLQSLQLDPFNADARFNYGYAIWRRIDATQLNAMAGQWALALALNPLHFQTHWHWGNGHTNRTFADYVDKDEKAIRAKLAEADTLFRQRKLADALAVTRQVAQQYPASVLPLMHRASLFYSDFDAPNRTANLDSAARIFRQILSLKQHYGPAHNGLSAVIKSKRIPYLAQYDSIARVLRQTHIPAQARFDEVFADVSYYPGQVARAMVWNQLYTSVAYFPMLARQGHVFRVPPLHVDLALAMNSSFFRSATTFDNRQWMDIRGVGSGAAAIEYVERGAFEERNVVLHEYVHLFHGRVLTDAENRRIRALYYNAMQHNLTLDYYSQNNESEYLAQTYPAYFETVKVHPLDFKSMNIRAELMQKDPQVYAFLDSLIRKERAFLAGNTQVMAANWAQVYLNLSQKVQDTHPAQAARLLDTALVYDPRYQPAYLAYARLHQQQNQFDKALENLKKAEAINPNYAPIYATYAQYEAARLPDSAAAEPQIRWLKKALELERDFQNRAALSLQLRDVYVQYARLKEAIETADAYVKTGARVSTYLRDRIDEAQAFAISQRAQAGYTEQLPLLQKLVEVHPQTYDLRAKLADALYATGRFEACVATLQQAQRILASGRNRRADFDLRLAECYRQLNRPDSVATYLAYTLANPKALDELAKQRLARLLIVQNRLAEADSLLRQMPTNPNNLYVSAGRHTQALLAQQKGQPAEAVRWLKEAVKANPYNLDAYRQLAFLYNQTNDKQAVTNLKRTLTQLPLPPGPAWTSPFE